MSFFFSIMQLAQNNKLSLVSCTVMFVNFSEMFHDVWTVEYDSCTQ